MIDKEVRSDLANCLHRLVSGAMTNDEFDDAYYGRWENSADAAVAEIGAFGYALYSSDLLCSYKLKGRHALSEQSKAVAHRALLFLTSEWEYEWPRNVKGIVPYWSLWGPGFYLVLGLILLFVALVEGGIQGWFFGPFGLLAVTVTVHWLFTYRGRARELDLFYRSGDYQVWPFLRRTDFDEARDKAIVRQ